MTRAPARLSTSGSTGNLLAAGVAALARGDAAGAENCFRTVLAAMPASTDALNGLGKALHDQARLDEAETVFGQATSHATNAARARYHLGLLRLLRGDHARGWDGWEERLAVLGLPRLPTPPWDGAPMPVRRLLVLGEQGFGDVIQFARFLPAAAQRSAARLTFGCAPPLLPLLAPFCAAHGIDVVTGRVDPGGFDAHAWLCSLPRLLGATTGDGGAYLWSDPALLALWRRRQPRRALCVGLSWEGRANHPQDRQRSIPPEALLPLAQQHGIVLVGLQRPPVGRPAPQGLLDMDWGPDVADFGVAASMLAALDLLVTVDTALAHLADALGLPALVLLSRVQDWRWGLSGEGSAWYASLHLLRQQQPGDWFGPIAAAAKMLSRAASRSSQSD